MRERGGSGWRTRFTELRRRSERQKRGRSTRAGYRWAWSFCSFDESHGHACRSCSLVGVVSHALFRLFLVANEVLISMQETAPAKLFDAEDP